MRRTRSLVSRLMEGLSLQVRDTVEGETPAAPLLAEAPAGYYPCPGNMVLLKADNHAAAVAKMLEARGVHYYWSWLPAKVGYDIYDEGAAVFSRAPITDAENLLLSQINDYNNWRTRRALGVCAGDVWYYTVHLGWWKDEVEPFAPQWEKLSKAAGAKQTAFLLGDFNSEADVRGEGYDLVRRSGWQDTYRLAQQRDAGYTVVEAIDGWRDAPDAAAKKRIDQIWCSKAVAVKSSRVVFGGLQEPQVSDHAGVMIELFIKYGRIKSYPIKPPTPRRGQTDRTGLDAGESYRELILENIEYDYLCRDDRLDRDMLNELVELMVDTVCSRRETIRIAGDDYPAEVVKSRFLKLNSSHIEYVLDRMRENTTYVRNIKKYLLAALYNAPATIDSYYASLVNHDLYGSGERR